MWKILQAIVLFATASLVFAKDMFNTIGINAESPVIIATGLGITTMLINRSAVSLLVMALFMLLVNLPAASLESLGLDRDMLLAAAICTLFLPWIKRATTK
jgi:hypothetical protein